MTLTYVDKTFCPYSIYIVICGKGRYYAKWYYHGCWGKMNGAWRKIEKFIICGVKRIKNVSFWVINSPSLRPSRSGLFSSKENNSQRRGRLYTPALRWKLLVGKVAPYIKGFSWRNRSNLGLPDSFRGLIFNDKTPHICVQEVVTRLI